MHIFCIYSCSLKNLTLTLQASSTVLELLLKKAIKYLVSKVLLSAHKVCLVSYKKKFIKCFHVS